VLAVVKERMWADAFKPDYNKQKALRSGCKESVCVDGSMADCCS